MVNLIAILFCNSVLKLTFRLLEYDYIYIMNTIIYFYRQTTFDAVPSLAVFDAHEQQTRFFFLKKKHNW